MEFNIYPVTSREWKEAFDLIPFELKDINFMPEWYQTWMEHESAEAYCIHFEHDGYIFLYPFFKRKINNYDLTVDYYDIQSAYGYGGVIVNKAVVPVEIGNMFNKLTTEWLTVNNIVAEFIREHPLLTTFKRDATYQKVRKNVYIETTGSYKIPDKHARQNVARAFSQNATIMYDEDCKHLDEFIKLYQITAHRLDVHPYYYFSENYFLKVKELLGKYCRLIHILKDETIIASAMYLIFNDKANLHLTGSDTAYQVIRSNDLLYYAAIQYSVDNGVKSLNVGGGLSDKPDDTLFKFKMKYASYVKDVMIGKNILNTDIYEMLTQKWALRHPELVSKYLNYFLKYHQEA